MSPEIVEAPAPDVVVEVEPWPRERVAESLVNRHAALAAGVGFIPVLGVDIAALTGIQLNLINRLCQLYGVEFTRQAGLNVIVSLMAGTLPVALLSTTYSILKAVPVLGQFAGSAAMAVNSGAVVYALGRVMIRHFERGGDLLNFDAKQARAYFREQWKRAPDATQRAGDVGVAPDVTVHPKTVATSPDFTPEP